MVGRVGDYQPVSHTATDDVDLEAEKEAFVESRKTGKIAVSGCLLFSAYAIGVGFMYKADPGKGTLGALIALVSLAVSTCFCACRYLVKESKHEDNLRQNGAGNFVDTLKRCEKEETDREISNVFLTQ